jgi:hypothetical protein
MIKKMIVIVRVTIKIIIMKVMIKTTMVMVVIKKIIMTMMDADVKFLRLFSRH